MREPDNALLPAKFPADWTISTVGAQFHVILGKMLDAEKNIGTPKPYLGNRSVQWGRVDLSDLDQIKLTEGDIRKYRLQTGDLLVCEGGDIGRAAIWQDQLDECYFQKALHRLRPRGGYSSVLMRYLLEYYARTGFLANFATQTSIAHLPKDKFVTVPLPLPSLPEQQAIAAALSDADGMVAGLERVIAKKRMIKQGAMQDLLTARRRIAGWGEPRAEDNDLPNGWIKVELGALAEFRTGPFGSTFHKSDYKWGGIPLINPSHIVEGEIVPDEAVAVSPDLARQLSVFVLQENDIVIGRRGDMGRCAVVKKQHAGFLCGTGSMIVRPTEKASSQLLQAYLTSQAVINKIEESSVGTTMINLNQATLSSLQLILPKDPLERQAIAAVLSDMDAEIQTLESRLAKARAVKEGMMQNLLTGRVRLV